MGRCGSFADVVILGSDTTEQRKRGRIATHGFGNSASCSQRLSVSRASRFLGKRARLGVSPGCCWLLPAAPGYQQVLELLAAPGDSQLLATPGARRLPASRESRSPRNTPTEVSQALAASLAAAGPAAAAPLAYCRRR